MTDREMLEQLFAFMVGRDFVEGDPDSIRDMTKRYKMPPMTMRQRVVLQMTKQEYNALTSLLMQIQNYLFPGVTYTKQVVTVGPPPIETDNEPLYLRNSETGELDQVGVIKNESV